MTNPLVENVTAISAVFHQHEDYRRFYERYGDSLSGFPGIWDYVGRAAVIFTEAESEHKRCHRPEFEFIDAVDAFVESIIFNGPLSSREIREAAKQAMQ